MKNTTLYKMHCKSGGKIIDFGGWSLPVQYTGILEEHKAVRSAAGLFDVSHMGEIIIKGPDAEKFVQELVTNDAANIEDGQVMYTPMCYHDGGVVDDILVYKFNKEEYLLVVNASNTDKDFQWLMDNIEGSVEITNVSNQYAQLALQGPKAESILQKLTKASLKEVKFYHFMPEIDLKGVKAMVSRTGYTGEDGFEIYVSSQDAVELWEILMQCGKPEGLVPVGLGARDTLRFEAALPLYGQELSEDISPLEAGLGMFVKLSKSNFIGKQVLTAQKQNGIPRKLVGIEMVDRGIARSHYPVMKGGENIGFVTSGSFSPSLGKNLGMALLNSEYALEGMEIEVVIRNKLLKAKIVKKPFYAKKYKK